MEMGEVVNNGRQTSYVGSFFYLATSNATERIGADIMTTVPPASNTTYFRVLALATEWGASQGGASMLNLEFCRAFSKAGHSVTCGLVSELGRTLDDDSDSVITVSVLYGPPKLLLKESFDLIVGHGLHSGPHARYYRDEYFKTARYIHVQHVDHVIEHDKHDTQSITKVDVKEELSRNLLAAADLAVGIGPLLTRTVERLLTSAVTEVPILRLDPGVPAHILNAPPRRSDRSSTRLLLVVGRAYDWKLKGFDIAAKASALLPRNKIETFRVRGVAESNKRKVESALKKRLDRELHLDLRPFEGPSHVLTDLFEADCVLLPSRQEGFGLSAFESLCLGVPTLITHVSGLADLLEEKCPKIANNLIVSSHEPSEWAKRIEWATSPDSFAVFEQVRNILTTSCRWENAIQRVLAATRPPRKASGRGFEKSVSKLE